MTKYLFLLTLMPLCATRLHAQTAADSTAIVQTALDYIDGWYTGDADRMESALHPDLAKRMVYADPDNGRSHLDHQSAMTLVQGTRAGYGKQTPVDQRLEDVAILDVFGNAASVKINASAWIDYLHMVRWNGQWKIINVLWELKPQEK